MTQGKRVALSAARRTELWSRWKAGGVAAHDWARLRQAAQLHSWFFIAARRDCSARSSALAAVLTAVEREDISRGIASGSSIRDIAKDLHAGCVNGQPRSRTPWWTS
jgi:hypothetical protein